MKWFKHYSNARLSNKLTKLRAYGGKEACGEYWTLLEMMSEKFNGEDTEFSFDIPTLRVELAHHTSKSLRKSLSCMAEVGLMSFDMDSHCVTINTDILLRLQGRDWKYDSEKRGTSAPKIESKIESKNTSPDGLPNNFAEEIIDYLNLTAKTKYKCGTKKTLSLLNGRFQEGFCDKQDYFTVIKSKCDEWLGSENYSKYLRPETLFGTKFESYLQAFNSTQQNDIATKQNIINSLTGDNHE